MNRKLTAFVGFFGLAAALCVGVFSLQAQTINNPLPAALTVVGASAPLQAGIQAWWPQYRTYLSQVIGSSLVCQSITVRIFTQYDGGGCTVDMDPNVQNPLNYGEDFYLILAREVVNSLVTVSFSQIVGGGEVTTNIATEGLASAIAARAYCRWNLDNPNIPCMGQVAQISFFNSQGAGILGNTGGQDFYYNTADTYITSASASWEMISNCEAGSLKTFLLLMTNYPVRYPFADGTIPLIATTQELVGLINQAYPNCQLNGLSPGEFYRQYTAVLSQPVNVEALGAYPEGNGFTTGGFNGYGFGAINPSGVTANYKIGGKFVSGIAMHYDITPKTQTWMSGDYVSIPDAAVLFQNDLMTLPPEAYQTTVCLGTGSCDPNHPKAQTERIRYDGAYGGRTIFLASDLLLSLVGNYPGLSVEHYGQRLWVYKNVPAGGVTITDGKLTRIFTPDIYRELAYNFQSLMPSYPVNAASFQDSGTIAPGEIVSVFGSGFTPNPSVSCSASSLPLGGLVCPGSTLGTKVVFNFPDGSKHSCLSVYVGFGQINCVTPLELNPGDFVGVSLEGDETVLAFHSVKVVTNDPGTFMGFGNNAAALHQDGSPVTSGNPAVVGEVVSVYATGLGLSIDCQISNGNPAPGNPPCNTQPVTATIGGVAAKVWWSGLAPGFVGLNQVNVQIPDGISGMLPIVIAVGSSTSASNAKITVQ